ncbi:MAG: von Willebrand factor type A domain-containing protein, partial [Myxococcales bacterium]|nr:von Willebrand factor type A domain-containing protein [Myxococcales bacterium]
MKTQTRLLLGSLALIALDGCGGASPHYTAAPSATPEPPAFAEVAVVERGRPADMRFVHYGVNPTIDTAEAPLSTFSVDVDTASYTVTRGHLERGHLPDPASVRVEEFVNRFDAGDTPPAEGPFAVHAEAFPSPNRRGYHVLRVGLKAQVIDAADRQAAHLTFVVDVSGSMQRDDRLGLVKQALGLLAGQLDARDTVAIVGYGGDAAVLL